MIAITRARHDPAIKEYLARKEAEGKTKKGALRCLKRHLARRCAGGPVAAVMIAFGERATP